MPVAEIVAQAMLWWASLTSQPVELSRIDTSLTASDVWTAAFAASGDVEWSNRMVDVTWCESRWRTDAVGSAGEWGLAQIHPIHQLPRVMGAEPQLRQARAIWEEQGYGAWTCAQENE